MEYLKQAKCLNYLGYAKRTKLTQMWEQVKEATFIICQPKLWCVFVLEKTLRDFCQVFGKTWMSGSSYYSMIFSRVWTSQLCMSKTLSFVSWIDLKPALGLTWVTQGSSNHRKVFSPFFIFQCAFVPVKKSWSTVNWWSVMVVEGHFAGGKVSYCFVALCRWINKFILFSPDLRIELMIIKVLVESLCMSNIVQ